MITYLFSPKYIPCIFYHSSKCLRSFRFRCSDLAAYYSSMNKPKVYITRPDVPDVGVKLLKEKYEVSCWSQEFPVPKEELLRQVKGKDALFCLLTDRIDKELLDSAGATLKVVSTMSVGYDHIDVAALKERGIKLGYTPNVLTDAVAELTVALLLATCRRLFEAHQQIVEDKWTSWSPQWMCGASLCGSTVGIVGFGRIGLEVARRLKPFKVKEFLYSGRSDKPEATEIGARRVPLENLLEKSDFVIVTCSLTTDTAGMFNDKLFCKMKKSSIFINTSRGGVVDQDSLQSALEKGHIMGAGLDVMTPEPLPSTHPLLKMKNCVILPHIGSATNEARAAMALLAARNIVAALEGEEMPAQVL